MHEIRPSHTHSTPAPRIADRIRTVQRRNFVGRTAELELFRSLLVEPAVVVLHLYGPGGVGKTTLLHEFAQLAQRAGRSVLHLDGRMLDASPGGFLQGLGQALALPEHQAPLTTLAGDTRHVLFIDAYETLSPLEGWLWQELFPQLPASMLIVTAGRTPLNSRWRTHPGWQGLIKSVALRNLRPEESRHYLMQRGLDPAQHSTILHLTHGHPLALALMADTQDAHPTGTPAPELAPDAVRLLLQRFVEHIPTPLHLRALELCAHVRVTTEELLAAALPPETAYDMFNWLRTLSFIEEGPQGLLPHDLAREVLELDLLWRNRQAYEEMHRQVRRAIVARFHRATGAAQQQLFFDLLYLHRHNPVLRPFYEWSTLGTAYARPAEPEDFAAIQRIVAQDSRTRDHPHDTALLDFWWRTRPDAFMVYCDASARVFGLLCTLVAGELTEGECAADPGIRAMLAGVTEAHPARPGETILIHRYWLSEAGPEDRAALALTSMVSARHWLTTPRLAWSLIVTPGPEGWQEFFRYLSFPRLSAAEFTLAGARYGVFAHDWRVENPESWLDTLGRRELARSREGTFAQETPAAPLLVLSQPDFDTAVRQALRDLLRPAALQANPLLRSRMVVEHPQAAAPVDALIALIHSAVAALAAAPKDQKFYRALWHTYVEPAPSQEAAAEQLDLPFNTYRYQLAQGIRRVVEYLWRCELGDV